MIFNNTNINDNAIKVLLKEVEKLIDRKLEERKNKQTSIRPSIAYKALGNNLYLCPLDGYEYKIWNGTGIELKACQKVWITIPHGRMEDMYICGLRK